MLIHILRRNNYEVVIHGNVVMDGSGMQITETGEPTSSATPVQEVTNTPNQSPAKYVEPDPRTVKCPSCPHPASDHTDAGCCRRGVQEKEFRSPGVMGYCNCTRTYARVMLAHEIAAIAEGFVE